MRCRRGKRSPWQALDMGIDAERIGLATPAPPASFSSANHRLFPGCIDPKLLLTLQSTFGPLQATSCRSEI